MAIIKMPGQTGLERIVFYAMVHDAPDDVMKRFGLDHKKPETFNVEVKMLVNGIEVPWIEIVRQCFVDYKEAVEKRAEELVRERLSSSRLQSLAYRLDQIEWEIDQEIKWLTEQPQISTREAMSKALDALSFYVHEYPGTEVHETAQEAINALRQHIVGGN